MLHIKYNRASDGGTVKHAIKKTYRLPSSGWSSLYVLSTAESKAGQRETFYL